MIVMYSSTASGDLDYPDNWSEVICHHCPWDYSTFFDNLESISGGRAFRHVWDRWEKNDLCNDFSAWLDDTDDETGRIETSVRVRVQNIPNATTSFLVF